MERCTREIAAIEAELRAGNPDVAGLEDWKWREQNEELFASLVNGVPYESPKHRLEAHATTELHRGTGFQPVQSERPKVDGAFAYIKSRLGVVREKVLQLGSPFDYARQVTLYIETDLPEPGRVVQRVSWRGGSGFGSSIPGPCIAP